MNSAVITVKRNYRVLMYTDYGSRVHKVLCSLCLAAKRTDRVNKSSTISAKSCERCGLSGTESYKLS